jgi:hypothetical protein
MLGVAGQIYAHVNYLHNIENPDGHKRAMNNVQKIVPFRGINFMPFMRSRPYQISPDDASNQPTSEHGMVTSPGLDISKGLQLTFPPVTR